MEIQNIDEFVHYFTRIHQRTLRVINTIPLDKFHWKANVSSFSCAELVIHISNINVQMYGETIQGNKSKYSGHDLNNEIVSPEKIIEYYQNSFKSLIAIINSLSKDDLVAKIKTPANIEITLWKWLRAMIEHEIHHRGQIYFVLNLLEAKSPPLYGLTSEEVKDLSN